MESYFASINTTMYGEIKSLADHIKQARLEIGRARPNEITSNRIPRAGKELDEIVRATKEATNTIMEAAETIMSADFSNAEAKAEVDAACMNTFEACSFQDVTGQRISKVVQTLTFIDDRLGSLLGAVDGLADEPPHEGGASTGDEALLNGPQLHGEGVTQDDVDSMFGPTGEDASADTTPVAVPAPVAAPRPDEVPVPIAATASEPAAAPIVCAPEPAAAPHDDPPTDDAPAKPNGSAEKALKRKSTPCSTEAAGLAARAKRARGRSRGRSARHGSCPRVASGLRQVHAHHRDRVRRAPTRRRDRS